MWQWVQSFFTYVMVTLGGSIGVSGPNLVSTNRADPDDAVTFNRALRSSESSEPSTEPSLEDVLPEPYGSSNPYMVRKLVRPDGTTSVVESEQGAPGSNDPSSPPPGSLGPSLNPYANPFASKADPYGATPADSQQDHPSKTVMRWSLPEPYGPVNPYKVDNSNSDGGLYGTTGLSPYESSVKRGALAAGGHPFDPATAALQPYPNGFGGTNPSPDPNGLGTTVPY